MVNETLSDEDVFVFEKAVTPRKQTEDLTQNKKEGRQIHQTWEKLGEATRSELSLASGYDLTRVDQHVKWALKAGYAKRKVAK